MTKEQIKNALQTKKGNSSVANSDWHREPEWNDAFNLYNQSNRDKLKRGSCGSCYRKVWEWLQK
jgi:hypothetical protein